MSALKFRGIFPLERWVFQKEQPKITVCNHFYYVQLKKWLKCAINDIDYDRSHRSWGSSQLWVHFLYVVHDGGLGCCGTWLHSSIFKRHIMEVHNSKQLMTAHRIPRINFLLLSILTQIWFGLCLVRSWGRWCYCRRNRRKSHHWLRHPFTRKNAIWIR